MIMDRLANAELYLPLHKRFAAAFHYLRTTNLADLADGEYEIDGKKLYVSIQSSPGKGRVGTKLEAHRTYIDVQYVIRGADEIGLKPTADCREVELPYDAGHDCGLFRDAPLNWITLPTGWFTIFYPDDGHAPLGAGQPVKKAVVKVQLED